MRIVIVHGRAVDTAVNKVADTLSKQGHSVKLLIWDRQNTLKNFNSSYSIHKFTLKAPYDRFYAVLFFPIWWIYETFFLLMNKCDIIHACDLVTLLPAVLVKLIKRVKLYYTIYDFYATSLWSTANTNWIQNQITNIVESIEICSIRFTDVLFLVDECRYTEVRRAKIRKLVYIYNSPPDNKNNDVLTENNNKKEVTIFYAGVISRGRGLEHIIPAIADLENVKMIIAGVGPEIKLVNDSVKRCSKINYIGWIPYDEVITRTLLSDIIFRFSDPQIISTKLASPNKLFEAMMCNKPIIVSDNSSMADIVKKYNCGLVVPYGDVLAIQKAILNLRDNPDLRQKLGANGRKAYLHYYSWDIMEKRLQEVYK